MDDHMARRLGGGCKLARVLNNIIYIYRTKGDGRVQDHGSRGGMDGQDRSM